MYKYLIVRYTVELFLTRIAQKMIEDSLKNQIEALLEGDIDCFDAIHNHIQEIRRIRRVFTRSGVISSVGHYFGFF